jgi:hypothetical protein
MHPLICLFETLFSCQCRFKISEICGATIKAGSPIVKNWMSAADIYSAIYRLTFISMVAKGRKVHGVQKKVAEFILRNPRCVTLLAHFPSPPISEAMAKS